MANNDLEKFLAGSGLNRVWEKVFSLVKILTGDVDVSTKGTLQKQLDDVRAIANGRKQGKVFATTDDMKTWLQNSANAGLLNIGDNLYIVEKDVPDWWISGVLTTADSSTGYFYTIEPLEGPKIDLSSYDTAISKLNGDIDNLTEKRKWTKVSFVGAVDVTLSIPSNKCAKVPITAEEICVEITVKRNVSTTIKFSQYLKTPGDYIGGYYNSEKYYGSYQLGYNNNIIYLNKSWLRVVDNGVEYNNADTVQVDVYYR